MSKQTSSRQSQRPAAASADKRAHGPKYTLVFGGVVLLFAAFVGYQLLGQNSASSGSQPAAMASDTDLTSLRAAETGQLGEPALVWFRADW